MGIYFVVHLQEKVAERPIYISIKLDWVHEIIDANVLCMACGGFGALFLSPETKAGYERKPCWQPFTRHKLYALCVP